MTLFVDKIISRNLGGITNNLRKAEYILAVHNLSFEKILNQCSKSTIIPSAMFHSGKYIVALNINRNLSYINMGFINYEINLDDNFDLFADCFSPKAVSGFHKLQQQVKLKKESELNSIELSDNDSDFEIAYGNYIEHRNRQ